MEKIPKENFIPGGVSRTVYYEENEWSGWKFWRKAIYNLDFPTIARYLRGEF